MLKAGTMVIGRCNSWFLRHGIVEEVRLAGNRAKYFVQWDNGDAGECFQKDFWYTPLDVDEEEDIGRLTALNSTIITFKYRR